MGFSLARGGHPLLDPDLSPFSPTNDKHVARTVASEAAEEENSGAAVAPGGYEEAVLLNQRLRAMLAQAAEVHQETAPRPLPRQSQARRERPARARATSVAALRAESEAEWDRIDRRSAGSESGEDGASHVATQQRRLSELQRGCSLPALGQPSGRPGGWDSSALITESPRSKRAPRLDGSVGARHPRNRSQPVISAMTAQKGVPLGWTRGLAGRPLPPPKLRWGQGPSYNAGDWNSR